MKKLFLFLMALSIIFSIGCDENNILEIDCNYIDFRYYGDSTDFLGELSNDYILVAFESAQNDSSIENFISASDLFDQNYDYTIYPDSNYPFKLTVLKFDESKTCGEIAFIIHILELVPTIAYVHHTIQTNICTDFFGWPAGELCVNSYSSIFYLKVFDENDLTDLNNMIAQTNTELIAQNQFSPQWFTVRATKNSNGNALSMANYFYESGLFQYSEPNIMKFVVEPL